MSVDKAMNVLVVDDHKAIVRIIKTLLTQMGFANLHEAANGAEALEKLKTGSYGLVISDWIMAPVSGFELLQAVRADDALKDMPFIMVSSDAKPEKVIAARDAGVSTYIVKPFTAAAFKQRLGVVIPLD